MISIFVSYFGASQILSGKCLIPIQVGKARAKIDLGILGDDSGDNISEKNPEFCELTGQYWAWKNYKGSDYYGFFHYRRVFDLSGEANRITDASGSIVEKTLNTNFIEDYGLTESAIEAALDDCDALIPNPFDVTSIGVSSVHQHYMMAPYHFIAHLDEAKKIIDERHPAYSADFQRAMNGRWLYPNNMFIFKAELFERYSAWLFDILFELEKRIDTSGLKWQEKRALGYIAERLFTVYALALTNNKKIRVRHVNRVFIADTNLPPKGPKLPESNLPIVTVAASTDRFYVQHMAALVASTLRTASIQNFIDFVILDGGLSQSEKSRLTELEILHPNCRISFVDMSREHLDLPTNSYFTKSTFFRISLPDLLPDREKVLFLDTDIVVLKDVTELYNIDLGSAFVAATRDLIMKSFVVLGIQSIEAAGSLRSGRYLSDRIGLKNSSDYFQAGVLLLNLREIRNSFLGPKMTHALRNQSFWFLDQDVLNKYMNGRVIYIDGRWNSVQIDNHHLSALDEDEQLTYKRTLDDPWIVHYAGIFKPWDRLGHPHGARYWSALRLTNWYEEAFFSFVEKIRGVPIPSPTPALPANNHTLYRKSISLWLVRRIWRAMPRSFRRSLTPIADAIKRKIAMEA